jgi:hypothetical protein
LTIGKYPYVDFKSARDLRDEAIILLFNGIDPNESKQAKKQLVQVKKAKEHKDLMTFRALYDKWYEHNAEEWAYEHAKDIHNRMINHCLLGLGVFKRF